ncbi:MAG: 4a-hydroxytetrahydrobiopterin dehydratase [Dechloromonas sp.]|nr:4a-hydroxytetrahydrobiopterin dehydratase [Dechloromonas sp.]
MPSCSLSGRSCEPCEGGIPPLSDEAARAFLNDLPAWSITNQRLEKNFSFRNHYEAMAFVNAVAWISHREDHHPELVVGYHSVGVRYWTHAIHGLSENDFICAAKIEQLNAPGADGSAGQPV